MNNEIEDGKNKLAVFFNKGGIDSLYVKRIAISLFFFMLLSMISQLPFAPHAYGQESPDYQKYGRIAIAVVKEDYAPDEVIEYEYLGRKKLQGNKVTDSFKFIVEENKKELTVVVNITHDLQNNKTLQLTVETQR